jgi:phosphatidylserine decarboxylase
MSHAGSQPRSAASLGDRLSTLPQYLIPQHLLSRGMHRLTRLQAGALTRVAIRAFARHFRVDLDEAEQASPAAYSSFNRFFTRALRSGARPLCGEPDAIVSPVDGRISQVGDIVSGRLIQAKGRDYDLVSLLGGDAARAAPFEGGRFATLYLSPRDYHRIHMPMDAGLRRMVYLPGRLFAVKPATVNVVPGLFARNERVACWFDTALGPMAMVAVGAIFVGSIETVWAGEITPAPKRRRRSWDYPDGQVRLRRGEEMGRFNMGSTVILLFGPGRMAWSPSLAAGSEVRMGMALGRRLAGGTASERSARA